KQEEKKSSPNTTLPELPNSERIASTNDREIRGSGSTHKDAIVKKQNDQPVERKEQEEVEKNERNIAGNDGLPKQTNNLPTPPVGSDAIPEKNITGSTGSTETSLTNDKGKLETTGVTSPSIGAYNTETAVKKDDNPDAQFASENSGNKGLRGFLRKVTRTFEKRTNIKATDDDRLLIAGLAIKMN
ncbi:MAG TPA: hypothetical protein VFI06_09585, partial [Chitinophagaceae bacterium]|nr:hypothetical protein [Chitinophagaceae bacterium]